MLLREDNSETDGSTTCGDDNANDEVELQNVLTTSTQAPARSLTLGLGTFSPAGSVRDFADIASSEVLGIADLDLTENDEDVEDEIGCVTGLDHRSKEAARWVHRVPFWTKPCITGLLWVLQVACQVLRTHYLAASVVELLTPGLVGCRSSCASLHSSEMCLIPTMARCLRCLCGPTGHCKS